MSASFLKKVNPVIAPLFVVGTLAPVPACNDRLVDTPTPSEGDATSGDDTGKTTSTADEQIDCATLTNYDCDAETHCRTLSAVDVDILPGDEYCRGDLRLGFACVARDCGPVEDVYLCKEDDPGRIIFSLEACLPVAGWSQCSPPGEENCDPG
ncbi:MAG: hypothetical protein V3V08_06515 [Nannocystaceae bacterium]